MEGTEARRAVGAAMSMASALGLVVDDAVVLSDSNRLVVHLMPCDVVARVTPMTHFASAEGEVALVRQLSESDSPIVALDPRVEPRVHVRDGFKIGFWTYVPPAHRALPPVEYARALAHLHVGLRKVDLIAPHFTDRVASTQRYVSSSDVTPELAAAARALLANTLRDLTRSIVDRRTPEQLLHGEPHPSNVLDTDRGPLFIDFENMTRGPIEYDLAWVPGEVCAAYADADQDLVVECRGLVLAIIATHRWSRHDRHPSGRESGVAFLSALGDGPPWPAIDEVA